MNSLTKPEALFARAKELEQPAVAITDSGTMFAAWDALKASKNTGVKLIMGCEFFFVDDLSDENSPIMHIVLLAKNHQGYRNLLLAHKLASDHFVVRYGKVLPRIDWNILERCSEGLVATTACGGGLLSYYINTRRPKEAFSRAKRLKDIFGDSLALEIQPHAMSREASPFNDYEDQRLVNHKLIKFGKELDIKVVATCDSHYLRPEQHDAHDALLAIGSGLPARTKYRLRYTVPEFYLKTGEEVVSFFKRQGYDNAEEFCENTVHFADMCEDPEWIDPKFSNPSGKELPGFPVNQQHDYVEFKNWLKEKPEDVRMLDEDVSYFRYWCGKGLKEKTPKGQEKEYKDRIIRELDVIEELGFSSYMLIVADIIDFCDRNGYPHGLGRGSCGGCLSAYMVGIHQADSIQYDLIFERFLNKEKKAYPDIDCDFASYAKPKVQEYLVDKYGQEFVAHVSNINTITPKVFARDIARAFEYGGGRQEAVEVGNSMADAIPGDCKTVQSALRNAPLFQEFAEVEEFHHIKDFANDIGGLPRALSTHAGGLVIGKRPLHEIVPVRRDKDGNYSIEYEKDRAEANGLVKMDILGLSTLDIISNTLDLIEASGKERPTGYTDFDTYDKEAYDLISRGDTLCVFQLGTSGGTIDLCRKVKPKSIEDIAIINSLARPSARDIREKFIATKNGLMEVDIMHPSLQRAFGDTYGFGLYEECLMYLAQDVAGWDLNRADRLRKLTKEKGKNPKKAEQYRNEFIEDSVNNGVDEKSATKIWDEVVDKFQGYGFNKSHAIFYSMLGFETAYLKAHYPVEFMTANLMHEDDSGAKISDKMIAKIKREMRESGIDILPPNINKSSMAYKILNSKTILTGFKSLKYMGSDAIPELLVKRPFTSFHDLMERVDGKSVRITAVQALAASGALDDFGLTRKQMFLYASDYRKKLQAWHKRKKKDGEFKYPWPDIGEWTMQEKYAMEVYYLGEAFCCGVKEAYGDFFDNWALDFSKLPDIFPNDDGKDKYYLSRSDGGIIEGVIVDLFEFKVKKEDSSIFGQTMMKVSLEDIYGNIVGLTIFPSGIEDLENRLRLLTGGKVEFGIGTAIHVSTSIQWYEGDISLIFHDLIAAAPPPPKPKDLKHKKVSMRTPKAKKEKANKLDPDKFLEQVEDELTLEGKSDYDFDFEA